MKLATIYDDNDLLERYGRLVVSRPKGDNLPVSEMDKLLIHKVKVVDGKFDFSELEKGDLFYMRRSGIMRWIGNNFSNYM
jgi:hypothetical protein